MSRLGEAEFGVSTFFAASHPNDKCGANGLPLTPNSIKVLGRFQYLKTFEHPAVCKYLDIVKTKNGRWILNFLLLVHIYMSLHHDKANNIKICRFVQLTMGSYAI